MVTRSVLVPGIRYVVNSTPIANTVLALQDKVMVDNEGELAVVRGGQKFWVKIEEMDKVLSGIELEADQKWISSKTQELTKEISRIQSYVGVVLK